MAYIHEARTLLREPVNTDFRQPVAVFRDVAAGLLLIVWRRSDFDFADGCCGRRALNGLGTLVGGGLGFAGLAGGEDQ